MKKLFIILIIIIFFFALIGAINIHDTNIFLNRPSIVDQYNESEVN